MNQIDLQKLKKMSKHVKGKKIPSNIPTGKVGCPTCTKKFSR